MEVSAAEFKAKCLKLMDEVTKTREPIIVTKRGKPLVKILPAEEQPKSLFGYMRGTVEILGDIVKPVEVEWNAMKDADPYEDRDLYGPVAAVRPRKPAATGKKRVAKKAKPKAG